MVAGAGDAESAGAYPPWGFKSPSGHQREANKTRGWLVLSPERETLRGRRSGLRVLPKHELWIYPAETVSLIQDMRARKARTTVTHFQVD